VPLQAALVLVLLLSAGALLAQTRAAQVMAVTGTVTAIDGQGRERALEKGADVRQGDRIVTGEGALVQMRMTDGGYISVRSATEMAIDRFNYDDKEAANSNVLFSLIKGGFRSITGLIGRTNPNAYSIRTTTATVGIRGTDHEPVVVLPGAPGGVPAGLYDKVNDGETFIRTERGQLALIKGQVGFAPIVPDRPPQALPSVPDFYKIEVKTDARDPKDATSTSKAGDGDKVADPSSLRPSLAARREALKDAAKDATGVLGTTSTTSTLKSTLTDAATSVITTDKLTTATLLSPTTTTTATKDLSSTSTLLTSPTLSTTTTTATKDLSSTSTLLTSPTISTTTSTLLTSPTTSTILTSPTLSTTTSTLLTSPATSTLLTAPTTSTTSTTSAVKSTTLISPTTTTTIKSIITK
jgi:hypothetical protein